MSGAADPQIPSPITEEAEAGREVLENCLLTLGALHAEVDRAPIAQALEAALGALTVLVRSTVVDPAHLEHLTLAIERVSSSAAVLGAASGLDALARRLAERVESVAARLAAARSAVIDAIVLAQEAVAPRRTVAHELPGDAPFRASVGLPALHRLPHPEVRYGLGVIPVAAEVEIEPDPDDDLELLRLRYERLARASSTGAASSLAPSEPVGGAGSEPTSPQEVGAAESARTAPPPPSSSGARTHESPKQGEVAQLRRQLGSFVDTIGVLGNLRQVQGEERWHERLVLIEQRLLDHLDALLALGQEPALLPPFDLIGELLRVTHDPHGHDFVRAFARSLVLGCIDGGDTARVAVLALAHAGAGALDAHRAALALGSNPAVDSALRRLVTLPSPMLQEMALDLMVARQSVQLGLVLPLLEHPDDRLRRAALRCLGVVPERDLAREHLRVALAQEFDDQVAVDAIGSLLLCDPALGLGELRSRLTLEAEEPGALAPRARMDMVQLLAIAGSSRDADLLARTSRDEPGDLEALGWFGDTRAADRLLAALERGASAPPEAAAASTSAPPAVRADATAEAASRQAERPRAAARALARLFDVPPTESGEPDRYEPTTIAAAWRPWIAQRTAGAAWPTRVRHGAPFQLAHSVEELERFDVPGAARATAALEIAVATGAPAVGVHDWITRQQQQIAVLRRLLESATDSAGTVAAAPPRRGPLVAGRWLGDAVRSSTP